MNLFKLTVNLGHWYLFCHMSTAYEWKLRFPFPPQMESIRTRDESLLCYIHLIKLFLQTRPKTYNKTPTYSYYQKNHKLSKLSSGIWIRIENKHMKGISKMQFTFIRRKFLAILGVKLANGDIPSPFEILNGHLSLFSKLKWKNKIETN
jgi:hypothetical protein